MAKARIFKHDGEWVLFIPSGPLMGCCSMDGGNFQNAINFFNFLRRTDDRAQQIIQKLCGFAHQYPDGFQIVSE